MKGYSSVDFFEQLIWDRLQTLQSYVLTKRVVTQFEWTGHERGMIMSTHVKKI